MEIKKICISGLGYIGLPTAALLANRGYDVIGVDVNKKTIEIINKGKIHIVEPDLDTFVKAAVDSGRLKAKLKPELADVFFISVPTPFKNGKTEHDPDMTYVECAARTISPYIKPGNIIILESTSPVGSTEMIEKIFKEEGINTESIYIAYCPERVLPGKIMIELVENDRIVGGINKSSTEIVADFYESFITGKVLKTDSRTAEMAKLVENASRDVQIAFANELSILSDELGINVWELIELANHHPRVNILNPGTGVGGHCIAVDPWFIVSKHPDEAKLIKQARIVNDNKSDWVIKKINKKINEMENPKVGFMGIAFKPDIDDLRESPALKVVESFNNSKVDFYVCEPNIKESEKYKLLTPEEVLEKCDLVIFLVSHKEFYNLDLKEINFLDFCGVKK